MNHPDGSQHRADNPWDDYQITCPKCGSDDVLKSDSKIECQECGYHVEKEWSN